MELDDTAKQAVRELCDAINAAVERSERVIEALESLRAAGYEPNLQIKLEIGLIEIAAGAKGDDDSDGFGNSSVGSGGEEGEEREVALELTDEDLRTLRSMKIRLE